MQVALSFESRIIISVPELSMWLHVIWPKQGALVYTLLVPRLAPSDSDKDLSDNALSLFYHLFSSMLCRMSL